MDKSDYTAVLNLILAWRNPGYRQEWLEAHYASNRRVYVTAALVRVAAVMAEVVKGGPESLAKVLAHEASDPIERSLLRVTDEIMSAFAAGPSTIQFEQQLSKLVSLMAEQAGSAPT